LEIGGSDPLAGRTALAADTAVTAPAAPHPRPTPRIGLAGLVAHTWSEMRADDVFGRAAQIAYYFLFALFPFLVFVIASLSVFGSADRGRALLFELLAGVLPPPAFQLISDTFNEMLRSNGPLKMSFGIILSLWSASMGMSSIMDTLNAAYRVKETRSLLKQYAVAMGLTLGLALVLIGFLLVVIFGNRVLLGGAGGNIAPLAWKAASVILLFLAFAITYYFAPNLQTRHWRWISPGSILSVLLLVAVSVGLRVYLHYFNRYASEYGSLGTVIVLLLYFYLTGIAVLAGGVLNGVLERQDRHGGEDLHKATTEPGQPRQLSIND